MPGNCWWYQSQTGYLILGRSCSTAHWKKRGTNDSLKLLLSPKILYRLWQTTGTPTYPIHRTHNDPVRSRAFSTSMLFNNSIIHVGSQAPTLDNWAQRPTERYSTVTTGTERCKTLAIMQWQALPADHAIHFAHHADSTYPKLSGIQQHHVAGSLLSRIFCLSLFRRIHCTSQHLRSNLAPVTAGYPGWQPCNPFYAWNKNQSLQNRPNKERRVPICRSHTQLPLPSYHHTSIPGHEGNLTRTALLAKKRN